MKKAFTLGFVILSIHYSLVFAAEEQPDFLQSQNIKQPERISMKYLKVFYGDNYIPHDRRRINPATPPFVPHTMKGDFKDCKSCHQVGKSRLFAGIQVPKIPKFMPTKVKAAHPSAKGSCSICHVNQAKKYQFNKFYLKDVYSRVYRPKP